MDMDIGLARHDTSDLVRLVGPKRWESYYSNGTKLPDEGRGTRSKDVLKVLWSAVLFAGKFLDEARSIGRWVDSVSNPVLHPDEDPDRGRKVDGKKKWKKSGKKVEKEWKKSGKKGKSKRWTMEGREGKTQGRASEPRAWNGKDGWIRTSKKGFKTGSLFYRTG